MEKLKCCSFINRTVGNEFLSRSYGERRRNELIFIFQLGVSVVHIALLSCLIGQIVLGCSSHWKGGTRNSFCSVEPCGFSSFSLEAKTYQPM